MKKYLLALVCLSLFSCSSTTETEKPEIESPYETGDVVYMKPDSTIGMIDGTMKLDDSLFVYRIEYSDKIGEKHHLVKTSKTIFGKKK